VPLGTFSCRQRVRLQVELVETILAAGSQFSSDNILPTAEDAVNSSDPNGALSVFDDVSKQLGLKLTIRDDSGLDKGTSYLSPQIATRTLRVFPFQPVVSMQTPSIAFGLA
jgi:hypothetical protein